MLSAFVIAVAASELPPVTALIAILTPAVSSIGSVKAAVIVSDAPDLTGPVGE